VSGAQGRPAPIPGYRLLRLLGQGAHGQVHLAVHEPSGRSVALKLVELAQDQGASNTLRQAFQASAQTALRLTHPDIVALHASGIQGTLGWLEMELVPGGNLARYCQPRRLLPEALVLQITARIALALDHAHRQGVVHRDVKPANILVNWSPWLVKLGDFGLARIDDGVQTGTGIVPGSPAYMAPEQLSGAIPTPKSDLYALGVTLFQLLTGSLPYEGSSMGELLRRVAEQDAPDPRSRNPDLPPQLSLLMSQLLARRPASRPPDGATTAQLMNDVAALWPSPS
jgi:eukaryotic-like serine/threonine-protein kinase